MTWEIMLAVGWLATLGAVLYGWWMWLNRTIEDIDEKE